MIANESYGFHDFFVFAELSFFALLVFLVVNIFQKVRQTPKLRSVAILVLGDVGRSPRMMYHAESFAKLEFDTYLIGYRGSKPILSLTSLSNVRLSYLSEPPPPLVTRIPFVLAAPIKILYQIATILYKLVFDIPRPPEFIMVQNPPSIPTLSLVWLVGGIMGSKVIIDWHNLGYSILALKLGRTHLLVNIAKRFEIIFGSSAYAHLFVTNAMRNHLEQEWGLIGHKAVLHDRPPSHFHKCVPLEVHELFIRLGRSLSPSLVDFLPISLASSSPSSPSLRKDRPALLVSSTSWTPDEDFGILLEALKLYESRAREVNLADCENSQSKHDSKERQVLPRIWMVITGKGPLKERYMAEVELLQKNWQYVRCTSLWLEAEDYPLLLGSADLGISLHSSSSALDLPMKIVDMFGCGLPVCALDFACLPELVKDRINGLVFRNASQLAEHLETLLTSFPSSPALDSLRTNLQRALQVPLNVERHVHSHEHQEDDDWEWNSWSENWNRVVKPLVLRDSERFG
ncbi:glycosyl transferases group 1-domain-containing protein [Suillus subaureus]|uniref:Chitobiosyldiphosphodolichol beta-mannosyltransferase n=1 Tax=Suillus subaureus TaxID=48587 RepID=A0A9P7EMS4_9AGAM|nr:glycosyl transferases group 1-domain-containing protein [Suillus subaureus]KAG1825487.1 glycosyl transferases group 1-domain-containing protein [Suillus subaureus]